jgi:hypothetical protein
MFSILPLFYLIGGFFTRYQPKWIDKRVYLILGAIVNMLSFFMIGPSKVLSLPK